MTKQFTGDLDYGTGIGTDDLEKMVKRAALIKDLQKYVRAQPAPGSGQRDLNDWLNKLGAYADETETMHKDFTRTPPEPDMALAFSTAAVEETAKETKPPAERFGLKKCTRVEQWEKLG